MRFSLLHQYKTINTSRLSRKIPTSDELRLANRWRQMANRTSTTESPTFEFLSASNNIFHASSSIDKLHLKSGFDSGYALATCRKFYCFTFFFGHVFHSQLPMGYFQN